VGWVAYGAVSAVKDQRAVQSRIRLCDGGSMESIRMIAFKVLVELFAQQIVDCTSYWDNSGY
jgi:hypothetical protein